MNTDQEMASLGPQLLLDTDLKISVLGILVLISAKKISVEPYTKPPEVNRPWPVYGLHT